MRDRDFAVVVGINKYEATSEFTELKGPTNDAEELIAWLKNPEGAGLPEGNVDPFVVLSNKSGRATHSAISEALRTLFTRPRPVDEPIGRRLYVFLAGHGFTESVTRALLHSVETRRDAPAFVSGTEWLDCFHERALFDELVLWMDCCRDYEPNFDPPGRPCTHRLDAVTNNVKRLYLLGTGIGKGAYEKDFQGKVHGLFSRALLDALEDEAIDGDGRMTAANVFDVVAEKLRPTAKTGLNVLPDPVMTPGFVLFDNLKPRITKAPLVCRDSSLKVEVFASDDRTFSKPFSPVRTENGALVFELPRWKSYTAFATNAAGRPVARQNFAVRNRVEPQEI